MTDELNVAKELATASPTHAVPTAKTMLELADEFDNMAKAHKAMGEKQEAANYTLAATALRATAAAQPETELLRGKVNILEGQLRAAMVEREPLENRRDGIGEWIKEFAPYIAADQKHLDENTPERAYWHYGYRAALVDVLNLPTATPSPLPAPGEVAGGGECEAYRMLNCPFCDSEIRHVESWAKSFNPPRLYHEWHHDETPCQIHYPQGGTMVANATDDPEMQARVIKRWNTRAAPLSPGGKT